MNATHARRVLGVAADASWDDVRRAYRDHIRAHHPDRAGDESAGRAAQIIEAYRTLDQARQTPPGPPAPPGPPPAPVFREAVPEGGAPAVARLDADTLALAAPAGESFRWLMEAAHDIGEITYLDRSGPILEVLCQFEGEPATSLMITTQGRANGTEAFCTTESIEAREGPPTAAVVDLLELALRRRQIAAGGYV